jgi:ABC-type glycerol-3-phosphate transport system permease component
MATTLTTPARVRANERSAWLRDLRHDWPIHFFLLVGLLISAIPIIFMLMISVKSQGQYMQRPLGLTFPIQWENYVIAFNVLRRSLLNSVFLAAANTAGSLLLAAISAYVFARFQFPGRGFLFWSVLAVLFIPGILTFAPRFVIVSRMGLLDTYWVMILPLIAANQIFEIFVLRSFFASISGEVIEAARVDGATVMQVFWRIVIPMSRNIMATLAVLRVLDVWNEWLWPLVTVTSYEYRPMALQVFWLADDIGPRVGLQMAGYALASIPMLIMFMVFNRQMVDGLTSGAIRG